MLPILRNILDKAAAATPITRADAERLVPLIPAHLPDIMAVARIAAASGGAEPFTCGIINAKSGSCGEDCAFCAQSARHGGDAPSTPLADVDALIRRAERYAADGIDHMSMVTAGRGPSPAVLDRVCEAARAIRERVGIRLCASLGIIDSEQASRLRDAGFSRYHHNLETSRKTFPAVCSTHTYDERLAAVAAAKAAGLKVCSGGIFGCGESWADRLDFSADLAAADPDAIPVNILIPVPGTPYADVAPLTAREGLGIVALFRLLHPRRNIIMCAGRASCLGDFGSWVYSAGANALMLGDYLTRKGGELTDDFRLLDMIGLSRADGRDGQ